MFSEDSWVDFCRPITTFYNSVDAIITAGELRQTKTRPISFYMIHSFFTLYEKSGKCYWTLTNTYKSYKFFHGL